MKQYEYYIFDFDGTVMNTERGIKNSIVYALESIGVHETDMKKLDYFIGPPLYDGFRTVYGVSDGQAKELIVKYRERYSAGGCLESDLYDGVSETLTELKNRGKSVAVASSKPTAFIEKIAKHAGVYDCFDVICGESFSNTSSSKKDLIGQALSETGCTDKSLALMTGDRHYDILGARDAGVASAGAVYGFGTAEELTQAGADFLINDIRELLY